MGKTWLIPYLVKVHFSDGHCGTMVWDEQKYAKPSRGKLIQWVNETNKCLKKFQIIEAHAFSQRTGKILQSWETTK